MDVAWRVECELLFLKRTPDVLSISYKLQVNYNEIRKMGWHKSTTEIILQIRFHRTAYICGWNCGYDILLISFRADFIWSIAFNPKFSTPLIRQMDMRNPRFMCRPFRFLRYVMLQWLLVRTSRPATRHWAG